MKALESGLTGVAKFEADLDMLRGENWVCGNLKVSRAWFVYTKSVSVLIPPFAVGWQSLRLPAWSDMYNVHLYKCVAELSLLYLLYLPVYRPAGGPLVKTSHEGDLAAERLAGRSSSRSSTRFSSIAVASSSLLEPTPRR